MRKINILLLLLISSTMFAGSLTAGNYKEKRLWWRNTQIAEELELTPRQINQIESIFQNYKGKIKKFNKDLNKKEKKLQKLIQNPDSTREDVLKVTDEINTIKANGQKMKVTMFWEIREVLTPKQRVQLKTIKDRYMQGNPKNMIFFMEGCDFPDHTFY